MKTVVTFIRDLMFGSKVDSVLASLGCTVRKARSFADIESAVKEQGEIAAAVLNLGIPGEEVFQAATLLISKGVPVFAYYPHVETNLRDKALECGVKEAYPRGAILDVLEKQLR